MKPLNSPPIIFKNYTNKEQYINFLKIHNIPAEAWDSELHHWAIENWMGTIDWIRLQFTPKTPEYQNMLQIAKQKHIAFFGEHAATH